MSSIDCLVLNSGKSFVGLMTDMVDQDVEDMVLSSHYESLHDKNTAAYGEQEKR
ncbi:hypothetical protein KHA80_20205 [Anaerobacillus sp. HL2]|nr:hypothetical protein KHA80_20205 [Anaerobacillus sp. HL2]